MKYFSLGCSTVIDDAGAVTDAKRLARMAQSYRRMGVDYLEVSHTPDMNMEEAAALRRICYDNGLITWSGHIGPISRRFEDPLRYIRHDAPIARETGASVIVMHPVKRLENGEFDYELYYDAAKIAAQCGLTLAIETCHIDHANNESFGTSYVDLIRLVDELNLPHVGINIDTGHVHLGERRDVEEVVRAVGPRLRTLHMQDNFGKRDDHCAPGFGLINWRAVIHELRRSPYEGPLMMEMTDARKQERAIYQQLGFYTPIEQEIVTARAWLKWLWDEDARQEENDK